jgi:hypothetical protein
MLGRTGHSGDVCNRVGAHHGVGRASNNDNAVLFAEPKHSWPVGDVHRTGGGPAPTGTVTFMEGGTSIGTGNLADCGLVRVGRLGVLGLVARAQHHTGIEQTRVVQAQTPCLTNPYKD